ncbi:hypothetical protein N0V82_002562 [Gnomoniopsis sp. IMI 355080]|nr:hypothetical protein N0V82_002562 [Gnomoniopsis sp. IMI 355080]
MASFRLRAPVALKGLGRKMTPLFMFFAPEWIQSLTYEGTQTTHVSDTVRNLLGDGDIVNLRFRLSKAGDLIVPPYSSVVPKKKVFWDLFDGLKDLSQQTDFLLHLSRDNVPSEDVLVSFCEAVSGGKLTTSAAHADVSRLYDGNGGKLLQGTDLAVSASAPMDKPPSYDELGSPPPAPPVEKEHLLSSSINASASSSRKRRRTSSNGDESAVEDVTKSENPQDIDRVEAICRKLMNEMTAKWREEGDQLRNELHQVETRIKDWVDERLDKHVVKLRQEIERTSVQQETQAYDQVQEVRKEVQQVSDETQETFDRIEEVKEDMQAFKDETLGLVDGRLEEQMDSVRSELEEYVVEQIHQAQDRIVDHIRSNVYIDFNIYD